MTRIRTQHDLARLLNVSRVTVQRALSDHPYVNDGLRAEIQAAAKKYGYRPFANAQSLRTGQTHAIGVLLFNIRSAKQIVGPVFFEFLAGITDRLVECEYKTIVVRDWQLAGDEGHRTPVLFRERAMDGLICTHPTTPLLSHFITSLKVPVVWLDSGHHEDHGAVWRDEAGAARLAVQKLVELGHRKITYLDKRSSGPEGPSNRVYSVHHSVTERSAGYGQTMTAEKLAPQRLITLTYQQTAAELQQILKQPDRPSAFVCYSVNEAFWLRNACIAAGLSVPTDVSIIALDDNASVVDQWPELGRISFDRYAMGHCAAEMMVTMLEKDGIAPPSRGFVDHQILGQTFAPPPMQGAVG
ncbi:MAG: LacI family DNA-binding transcriptional regulator [Phycisphaerales bacterium]|nr:LacI family DNA-binding transcriptional regulator [Phycisphaerales bacterium]